MDNADSLSLNFLPLKLIIHPLISTSQNNIFSSTLMCEGAKFYSRLCLKYILNGEWIIEKQG